MTKRPTPAHLPQKEKSMSGASISPDLISSRNRHYELTNNAGASDDEPIYGRGGASVDNDLNTTGTTYSGADYDDTASTIEGAANLFGRRTSSSSWLPGWVVQRGPSSTAGSSTAKNFFRGLEQQSRVRLCAYAVFGFCFACFGFSFIFPASSTALFQRFGAPFSTSQTTAKTNKMPEAKKDNPLLFPASQLFPPFATVKADDVVPGIAEQLRIATVALEALEASITEALTANTLTYEKVALEVERFDDELSRAWGTVKHLKSVADSPELRQAVDDMQPKVIEFGLRMGQSEPLFKAWDYLAQPGQLEKLTPSQKRIVESERLAAKLSGVGLTGEKKETYNKNAKRMGDLKTKFTNNLQDATKAFSLKLTTKAEVAGLPASALSLAAQTAKSKFGESDAACKEATPENGPWVFTLDMPSYLPVMQHAHDRALRQKMYQAHLKRASEFTELKDEKTNELKDNTPLIQEILKLRLENAQLLGYTNYAETSLAKKMATLDSANKLIEDLRASSMQPALKELEDLEKFAKKEQSEYPAFPASEKLMQWDVPFYAERMKEAEFSFKEEDLKPYFSLPKVLVGLFQLAKKLFDIDIVELASTDAAFGSLGVSIWHPDVKVFEIKREGKAVSYFFLDPYSRPETKKGGAWMDEVAGRTANPSLVPSGNNVRLPIAHMVCNQSPPIGDEPSLMTFREVETLFHEFGHALQHMLTKESEGLAAGIRKVEWDAVEQPSQFMENFCYDRSTIDKMALHYKSGEKIPDDLWKKVVAAKNFRAASMMLRQLHFSHVDLELHSNYDPNSGKSIWDVDLETSKKFDVLPLLPYDRFLCSFAHIFAGGYAAGYFSYKWAEVLSADCFAAFEEAGLNDEEKVKSVGRKFADTILGLGGGVAPLEVFKLFRGREPTVDALLRHNGLGGEKPKL
ncbi:unnamed protein product [Amoebophrya sp. A25]|nr:unnamed protein product [Amoebophrya sp. A25]|eukprot:GSA25T00008720001.1